ncbi:MAG TPA: hypothetical protein VGV89_01510 [Thermoplasmata archaeon]|nr:hypothetical protein [Thermoplasmata archaeon]
MDWSLVPFALGIGGFLCLGYLLFRPHGWFTPLFRERVRRPHQVRFAARPVTIAGNLPLFGPIRGRDEILPWMGGSDEQEARR